MVYCRPSSDSEWSSLMISWASTKTALNLDDIKKCGGSAGKHVAIKNIAGTLLGHASQITKDLSTTEKRKYFQSSLKVLNQFESMRGRLFSFLGEKHETKKTLRKTIHFYQSLMLGTAEELTQACRMDREAQRIHTYASWININKRPISELNECINTEELKKVLALLEYLEFDERMDCTLSTTPELFSACSKLKTLKISSSCIIDLPSLRNIEHVSVINCPNVSQLGSMPKLKTLKAFDCPRLCLPDEDASPYQESFEISNCPKIAAFPIHIFEYKVNQKKLKSDPVFYLDDLQKLLNAIPKAANNFSLAFLDDNGAKVDSIDIGGLTRSFFSDLFSALKLGNKLSFLRSYEGGFVPNVVNEKDRLHVRTLGQLVGMCLRTQDLRIVPFFKSSVFTAIFRLKWRNLAELTPGIQKAIFLALNEDAKDIQKLARYGWGSWARLKEHEKLEILYYAYPEGWPEDLFGDGSDLDSVEKNYRLIQDAIQEVILKYAQENHSIVAGVYELASSIIDSLKPFKEEDEWEFIHPYMTPLALEERIEGKFSKENFLNQLEIENDEEARIKNVFRVWVEESDTKDTRKFLKAICGSESLGSNDLSCRVLYPSDDEPQEKLDGRLPAFHTCSNSFEIPSYSSYAQFRKQLSSAFEEIFKGKEFSAL
jgi:hypothetical protein